MGNHGCSELEGRHGHRQTSHAVCGGVFGGSKSALCDYFLVCVCWCRRLHRANQASVLFRDKALLQRFFSMHLKCVVEPCAMYRSMFAFVSVCAPKRVCVCCSTFCKRSMESVIFSTVCAL